MAKPLAGQTHEFDSYTELLDYYYQRRWTDGHPIVPPTDYLVQRFLNHLNLEPDATIADFPARNLRVTAEGVAMNAVMAGCRPEYLPILVAGVKAMAEPEFEFNHIACLQSTYPHFIVSGPIVRELDINHGMWAWGSGDRATSTIGRAFSLILWNLLDQKPGGIQRGQFGQPGRWCNTIAENPDTPWTPLNVTEGFPREVSTITCTSLYPDFGQAIIYVVDPDVIMEMMAARCFTEWRRSVYLIQVTPQMAELFADTGWSKERLTEHIKDNVWYSVAELKRRGQYGGGEFTTTAEAKERLRVNPGDEMQRVYLFRRNDPALEDAVWSYKGLSAKEKMERYRCDVMFVVNGGDTGTQFAWRAPHGGFNPVTVPVERPEP